MFKSLFSTLTALSRAVSGGEAQGCECWDLSEKAGTALRSWNARRLAMITGKEIREEYFEPACDLPRCARATRLKWVGQLLRAKESFLPRRVAMVELERTGGKGQPEP
jgi:hypothetical protein